MIKNISCDKAYIFFLVIACMAAGPEGVSAKDDPFIREASGITENDVQAAAQKKELSLFDAYALSVSTTELLPIAREDLRQAQAHRHQAIGRVLPRLSIQGSVPFPEDTSNGAPSQTTSVSLILKQPLISGLNEVAGFKGSCHEIAIRRDMLAHNAGLLLYDVTFGFYQIMQLQKSLKNNEQILDIYRKIVNELNRRIAVGKSRKSEVLRTYGQLYAVEAQIRSLRNELARKRLEFTALTGVPAESALTDAGDIPGPEISMDDIKKMVDNRPDIKASRGQVKLADTRMWEAIGGHFPSAYLGGTYRLYQDNPQTNREFYGSLGFELPLFIGEVPGRAEEMWSLRRQAELNLAKNARNAEKEIRDSFQTWESSRKEIESYRNALTSAEENSQVILTEYRLNLTSILDVLTALSALQTARDDYERIVLQHRINRIRLGVATNEFSGDGIHSLKKAIDAMGDARRAGDKKTGADAPAAEGGAQ